MSSAHFRSNKKKEDFFTKNGKSTLSASNLLQPTASSVVYSASQLDGYTNPHRSQRTSMTKKLVKVINGKYEAVPNQERQSPLPRGHSEKPLNKVQRYCQSQTNLPSINQLDNNNTNNNNNKNTNEMKQMIENVETILSAPRAATSTNLDRNGGSQQSLGQDKCSVEGKSYMENEVDSFININEVYYKHIKGICVCYKCTCGKHKCAFAKNSHLKQPFNLQPAQSIYRINYIGKPGLKGVDFDYGMYENMKSNAKPIDNRSVNHSDYVQPGMESYGANLNFKPVQHYESNPLEVGRSHYKRDFLEWGCVPYQPIKGYSQRTTIDAMPFHGLTTYTKDFQKMVAPKMHVENKNHTTTMVKSPIPFLGVTTNQDAYKRYKQPEPAIRYKASDELVTGAPSFLGQFNSLHNKDFINFSNICPVEKDQTLKQAVVQH